MCVRVCVCVRMAAPMSRVDVDVDSARLQTHWMLRLHAIVDDTGTGTGTHDALRLIPPSRPELKTASEKALFFLALTTSTLKEVVAMFPSASATIENIEGVLQDLEDLDVRRMMLYHVLHFNPDVQRLVWEYSKAEAEADNLPAHKKLIQRVFLGVHFSKRPHSTHMRARFKHVTDFLGFCEFIQRRRYDIYSISNLFASPTINDAERTNLLTDHVLMSTLIDKDDKPNPFYIKWKTIHPRLWNNSLRRYIREAFHLEDPETDESPVLMNGPMLAGSVPSAFIETMFRNGLLGWRDSSTMYISGATWYHDNLPRRLDELARLMGPVRDFIVDVTEKGRLIFMFDNEVLDKAYLKDDEMRYTLLDLLNLSVVGLALETPQETEKRLEKFYTYILNVKNYTLTANNGMGPHNWTPLILVLALASVDMVNHIKNNKDVSSLLGDITDDHIGLFWQNLLEVSLFFHFPRYMLSKKLILQLRDSSRFNATDHTENLNAYMRFWSNMKRLQPGIDPYMDRVVWERLVRIALWDGTGTFDESMLDFK